ncbi:la-related protein 1C-like [Cynara cardunculus var. scolymus]|uniref:RNA-binding protein Lupus La n=1 Tax=Cynara cardunculus var. scolymus TaxID=59895 RepID=A0A118K313_CYNCS|nr:la-related protein 1C-like [Cynara cardunculus var. scolymus]KVI05220.1 RNA-binding protein Lupus La [Cynara cardunculus var. scolymus]
MTADASTATITHSGEDGGGGLNSPSGPRTLPSAWAQVVRGGSEPDSVSSSPSPGVAESNPVLSDPVTVVEAVTTAAETQQEGSDGSNNCNAGGVKKSAWNKPSANGVVDGTTTPVMGAASWPALSESTRPGVKSLSSSSESSSKPISDGSVAVSQAPAVLQPPQKHVRTNANSHSNPNHMNPVRQRHMRRGGSAGGASTGYSRPPPPPPLPPPFPLFDMSYGNLVPAVLDSPVREPPHFKSNSWSPRNPTLRNNYGPRPRSDGGSYVNNGYGGNRDHNHDRDWRSPRNPAARDVHQMVPPPPPPIRGFIRPPHPGPAPFIPPQPLRPYGTPMGYEMGASYIYVPTLPPEPYRGAPLLPHAPSSSMFVPLMDPPLHVLILNQIDYYFSDANLVKDNFLRSQMDEEGWVPIALIAGFRRVQSLTNDIQMILNSLRDSATVEIQGEKVRRRSEWRRWIQSSNSLQADTEAPHEASVEEASVQKLSLDDKEVGASDPLKLTNGEVSSEDLCS